jgi:hypothetical protein
MTHPAIDADRSEWREFTARVLHDAATGRIVPDPNDPTPYGAMAEAVLDELLCPFEEEIARLREALDLLRPAHHTPYADEEHQGGNCVDWVMPLLARAHKAESAARSAVSLLGALTEAHASIVMDTPEDTAAQDQLVEASRRGVSALRAILAEVS